MTHLFLICRILLWSLPLVGSPALTVAATTPSTPRVEHTPPQIVRRSFDPKRPPAEMPPLKANEAAICEFKFACDTRLGVEMPRFSPRTTTATVNTCTVITRLDITIWTPVRASSVLVDHEETHREICEFYYTDAGRIAQDLAQSALGRKLTVPSSNRDEAIDQALHALQSELMKNYLAQTADRCIDAQVRFDQITDHSRNPIGNPEAKARAIEEESARDR